jgi:hypothetical protein
MRLPGAVGGGGGGKGKKALAWISFGFAVVAGAAFAVVGLGGFFDGLLGMFGLPWLPALLFAGVFIAMTVDLIVDAIPNQIAMWSAMLLPSLAQSVNGKLSQTVRDLCNQILSQVNAGLSSWFGVAGALGIGVVCAVAAYLMGRRVLAKGG